MRKINVIIRQRIKMYIYNIWV